MGTGGHRPDMKGPYSKLNTHLHLARRSTVKRAVSSARTPQKPKTPQTSLSVLREIVEQIDKVI